MKVKKLLTTLAIFPLLPLLTNCGADNRNYSYYLEANTTNLKTDYFLSETFDPTGLVVNLVTLADGEIIKQEETTDYTFSIDLEKPLSFEDSEIYLFASDDKILPATITLNIQTPVFGIGNQMNLNESFKGYTFESDKPFIGRVKADGTLETYREGTFSLTGTHPLKDPIFFECEVKENEDINYESYIAKGAGVGGFLLEVITSQTIPTNSKFKPVPRYDGTEELDVRYEFTNPELFKMSKDPEFGTDILETNSKTGSSRMKIYLNSNDKLIYDLYVKVSEPFTPHEIKECIGGTHWISYALSGERFALNFLDGQTATLSGYSNGAAIQPFDFTFEPNKDLLVTPDKTFATFSCVGNNDTMSLKEMYVDINLGTIMLYNSKDNLVSIFNLDLE